MAMALVVMVVDEHDLGALYATAPHGSVYAEMVLRRPEWQHPSAVLAREYCWPMLARIRQERGWPRG